MFNIKLASMHTVDVVKSLLPDLVESCYHVWKDAAPLLQASAKCMGALNPVIGKFNVRPGRLHHPNHP